MASRGLYQGRSRIAKTSNLVQNALREILPEQIANFLKNGRAICDSERSRRRAADCVEQCAAKESSASTSRQGKGVIGIAKRAVEFDAGGPDHHVLASIHPVSSGLG